MQKIRPCLWFDGRAEEAMNFYTSIFERCKVLQVTPGPNGKALGVNFELDGFEVMGLNGGPHFKFTPAISMFVRCQTQAEVDRYWDRLLDGGQPSQCGWLTDRFGVSWQIVPDQLGTLLQQPDRAKAARVMQAMMGMVKLDIAALEAASAG